MPACKRRQAYNPTAAENAASSRRLFCLQRVHVSLLPPLTRFGCVRAGTPLETPVADMSSVFSWFLGAAGSPRSISETPTAAAAAAAAALFGPGGPTPTFAALADANKARRLFLRHRPKPGTRAKPPHGFGLTDARRRACQGGASAAGRAPAEGAAGASLTADQGRMTLLQKLLAGAGAFGSSPAAHGKPTTPLGLSNLFSGGLSPLGGPSTGLRRSPRIGLAPIRTGGAAAGAPGGSGGMPQTPVAAHIAELLQSPNFTQAEMQLLVATLGGMSIPRVPGPLLLRARTLLPACLRPARAMCAIPASAFAGAAVSRRQARLRRPF